MALDMKLRKTLLLIGAIAAPMFAMGAVQKGAKEIDFSLSGSWMDTKVSGSGGSGSLDVDMINIGGSFGYFVTDAIQTTVGLAYLDVDFDGAADLEALLASFAVDYHFNTQSTFVPYIGAAVYYGDFEADVDGMKADADDWAWEVRAGLKQFITDNVAIRYTVSYFETDGVKIGNDMKLELDGIQLGVGLSVFF